MTLKKITTIFILVSNILIWNYSNGQNVNSKTSDEFILIEYPEVYELANITLALTNYGKTDDWEVRKKFAYYDRMMKYFEPFSKHPLIDSVNFSRKRWEEYLSFRTDAYAFIFDENSKLKRINNFQSFKDKTFDKYLELIQDFADKSNFRKFYKQNQNYYDSIKIAYRQQYMLNEMKSFLTNEFGNFFSNKKYIIVLSPFVYAHNLHRDIDSLTTADFPTIAESIVKGNQVNRRERCTEIHSLFTEMDHGYVNPTTDINDNLVTKNFDENIWNNKSGYEKQGNAVFNEYMTWAVYDLFNQMYYPELADEINLYWHFQNESRGFIYSQFFAQKLKELYKNNKQNEHIKDLYPKLLKWTYDIQKTLTKPTLIYPTDSLILKFEKHSQIKLKFSEKMQNVSEFNILLQDPNEHKDTLTINKTNNIKWSPDRKELTFDIALPENSKVMYLIFNWWGTKNPLISANGVILKTSYFQLNNNDEKK
ncbi:MAG: DUF4932 domain-containing protein [Limnohabitans sp.]|nr:DUF4932 domain-containing protein [Limnohabitans sp.]